MPSLPPLSPEQRADALVKAAAARHARAELKGSLKAGQVGVRDVFRMAYTEQDEAVLKMPVFDLLKSLPGVGDVRARQLMQRLGIAEGRRIRGLGDRQRAALEAEFAPVAA